MSKLENILDWQFRLSVRETVLQGASEDKKIKITRKMMEDAKAEAKEQTKALMVELMNEVRQDYTSRRTGRMTTDDILLIKLQDKLKEL